MSRILETALQFRADLLARERLAAGQIVQAYGTAWLRMREDIDRLLTQIGEAQDRGETVNRAWLRRFDRLETLKTQVEAQMEYFARNTEAVIVREQQSAVQSAQGQAQQLVLEGLGQPPPGVSVTWNALPTEAFTDLVGTLQEGSPLRDLLNELPAEASAIVERELLAGLALGQNPREIARRIRNGMGMPLTRALRISRTEVLRSYRTATLRHYQENADVVDAWIWVASLSGRTCPACLAMHGKEFPLDVPFGSHTNCRCVAVPKTRTWADMGFDGMEEEDVPDIERGADWLARQSAEQQDGILGKAAGKAYRAGAVILEDFVRVKQDKDWGTSRQVRSLEDALNHAEMRQSRKKA